MKLTLLDCTLRDGGYVNDWRFGKDAIVDMTRKLESTGVEILELGFIKDEPYDKDRTVFNSMEQVKKLTPNKVLGVQYAVRAEVVNPLPLEKLAPADPEGPEIIRVIVWKRMLKEGYEYCKGIVEKGYKLCVQPARVSQYSDEEFVEMVELFNQLDPLAIYVVDSWGTMYSDTLLHYMRLADKHMKPGIAVGYHGHNNMMQAFDVACAFARQNLERDMIIDASVYGIGRGAGNLNLELFAKWMNDAMGRAYDLAPMMAVYDKYIKDIYQQTAWGFSLPYFVSAKYNCNPNFASYFDEKGLSVAEIEKIISAMPEDERIIFSKEKADKKIRFFKESVWKNILCIVVPTCNRPNVIDEFLEKSVESAYNYCIDIIIYDSSNDTKTKNIVDKYKNIGYSNVYYDFYDGVYNGVSIDEKVISAYKKYGLIYEYVWLHRDGLGIDIKNVILGIEKYILNKFDLIIVDWKYRDYKHHGNKVYTDCGKLFHEQCHQLTVLGASVIKGKCAVEMVDTVPLDEEKNLGIWQPYAIFKYFSDRKFLAASWVGDLWIVLSNVEGGSFWHCQTLWQWGERWYKAITYLPDVYNHYKKEVLKFELIDCKPFKPEFIAKTRSLGGLNIKKINQYKQYLPHVCNTPIWKFYAIALLPKKHAFKIVNRIQRLKNNYHHFINKHIRRCNTV